MGSRLGWILGIIFGGFLVFLIVKVVFFPGATDPTSATTAPGMLVFQQPRQPITLALGHPLAEAGDAGDDYHRAWGLYESHRPALRKAFRNAREVLAGNYRLGSEELAPFQEIASAIHAGAQKKAMTYYLRLAPKKIESPYYPVEALKFQALGNVPALLAAHHVSLGAEGYDEAEAALLDLLVMGYHLMQERARMDIVQTGVGLQNAACDRLADLYARWNKPDRASDVNRYKQGIWDIGQVYSELHPVIWTIIKRGESWGPHPGDVFNLVEHHADRAVRVEAILGLGMVQYTADTRGDKRKVRSLMRGKLRSSDPIERAAAECAQAMTMADLNNLDTQYRKLFDDWSRQQAGGE